MSCIDQRALLLNELLDASNQCQIRFGGRTELATEFDKRVIDLCSSFERALSFGLKHSRGVKSFTRKVVGQNLAKSLLGGKAAADSYPSLTLWQFISLFLNKHELERYNVLKNISTDLGRTRAWLRSALNEHSLERYIRAMLEDQCGVCVQFYEENSILRDQLRKSTLTQVAKSLSEILFAINIDNPELDQKQSLETCIQTQQSDPLPLILPKLNNDPLTSSPSKSINIAKKKGRKAPRSNVVSFLENEQLSSLQMKGEYFSAPSTPILKPRHLDIDSFSSHSPTTCNMSQEVQANSFNNQLVSRLDEDGSGDECISTDTIASNVLLTPITSDNLSLSDSFTPAYEDDLEKTSLSHSYNPNEESSEKLGNILEASESIQEEFEKKLRARVDDVIKRVELKQSKLEIANEKLQKENDSLNAQLKKYITAVQLLKPNDKNFIDQFAYPENQCSSPERQDSSKSDDMETVIECLNTDLIADETQIYSNEARESSPEDSVEFQGDVLTKKEYLHYKESIEYEKKLIQVAEMHGELVEFNDRLHRILMQKDATIRRLKDELIELRGPLPEGIQSSDEDEISSIVLEVEPQSISSASNMTCASASRPLINIWIPSAFMAGQQDSMLRSLSSSSNRDRVSTSSHHVYQIYVRIKDEEWNVYRRYSQFYTLNKLLKKQYPQIALFEFPPKKAIGNKHAKVVQERRKKLEAYLRNVLNTLQRECDILDKTSLVRHLPFLSEKKLVLDSDVDRDSINSDQQPNENLERHFTGF